MQMDELLNLPCRNPLHFPQQFNRNVSKASQHQVSGSPEAAVFPQDLLAFVEGKNSQSVKTYLAVSDRADVPEDQVIRTERTSILVRKFYQMGLQRKAEQAGESSKRQSSDCPDQRPGKVQRTLESDGDQDEEMT